MCLSREQKKIHIWTLAVLHTEHAVFQCFAIFADLLVLFAIFFCNFLWWRIFLVDIQTGYWFFSFFMVARLGLLVFFGGSSTAGVSPSTSMEASWVSNKLVGEINELTD